MPCGHQYRTAQFNIMKVQLGTANLLRRYGIQKNRFELTPSNVEAFLRLLSENQEVTLDTAPSYGNAQEVIGQLVKNGLKNGVSTKVSPECYGDEHLILESVTKSKSVTNVIQFDSVLLHGVQDVEKIDFRILRGALNQLLSRNLSRKVGVSCYTEREIEIFAREIPFLNVFQVPENILDQRLISSPVLNYLADIGKEIFVRSIFLQGILLRSVNDLPRELSDLKPFVVKVESFSNEIGISKLELLINYVKSIPWASGMVIGVDRLEEFSEILHVTKKPLRVCEFREFKSKSSLIDPRTWKGV